MLRVRTKLPMLSSGSLLAGVMFVAGAASTPGTAQTAPPSFAPNPSVGWVAMSGEFMAPPSGAGPVRRDPAHPRISNDDYRATGAQPTFPMGDVNSPILQPWARDVLRKRNELVLSGKAAFPRQASCWPVGVPAFLLYPVQPVYFIQSPKEVVMIWQADHQVRRVHLTDKHSARVKPSWFGESIGHYEGDTLVVETAGLNAKTGIDRFNTQHTEQLRVEERFELVENGQYLRVVLKITDPGAFTAPFYAQAHYRRQPQTTKFEEIVCAENNRDVTAGGGLGEFPIPKDDSPDF